MPTERAWLRPLTGSSAKAMMLRAFLPVVPAVILVELLFERLAASGMDPALKTALTALAAALVVAGIVFYASRGVSRELARAQTDREHALRDADLAAIVQSSANAIYAIRPDGTIITWNASAERLYGYSRDEALGQSARMLVPPDANRPQGDSRERVLAGLHVDQVETLRLRKDGSRVLVSISESPLRDAGGRVVGLSVIAHDVSERRRAERALLESEERFRQIAENISQVFWLTDPAKTQILYVSPAYAEIWQRNPKELFASPRSWADAIHPDDRARVMASALTGLVPGEYSEEYRIVRPDGSIRWIWDRAFPVRDSDGKLSGIAGLAEDITERKAVADALRESERRFSSILANLDLASLMLDPEARITYCNDYLLRLTGWAREEVLGRNWFDLFVPPGLDDLRETFSALFANLPTSWHHENEILTRAGERRLIRWNNSVLRSASGEVIGTASIGEDITEHRRTEERLRQAQRLEAVGRLAGGVAHDFNNSLGVILGYTELLLRQASDTQRGKLEQILEATRRSASLTRQLLTFSRKQVVNPKVLDLNAVLSELKTMVRRLIGEGIDLALVTGAEFGRVKADPSQLEQVVVNLCLNAMDAMASGGSLRIETANAELQAGHPAAHGELVTPGRYVMLSVADTGCGIEKEMLANVFEPFFTTKERDRNAGLGLAMVYGIVKQAGGYIWVDSEVGRGTTFRIYLPKVEESAALENAQAPALSEVRETILLVEDQGQLRAVAREMLEGDGYRVLEAASPSEALAITRRHPESIHLLVTDVVMPEMNGRALAEAVRTARPDVKILYISGYSDDIIAEHGVLEPGTHFLAKPFTQAALRECVRAAVGPIPRSVSYP